MAKKKSSSKKSSSSNTDNAVQLYEWLSDGYSIDTLVEAIRSNDKEKIDNVFTDFSERIGRLQECAAQLEDMGFDESHGEYKIVQEKLHDPLEVDAVEQFMREFQDGPRLKELKAELASLNTKGFEDDADKIIAMFDDGDIDDIEKAINTLKKRIKERFFENSFEKVAVTEDIPQNNGFVAETIFLLHKDGTLLSVKSKKPPAELDKKLMSKMVMAIKEQMNKAYKEGEHVHSLNYQGHTIILEDSKHVYAAVVIVGESKPVMYCIILKALQIMEKKLSSELENWTGDRSNLENLDKYTTAIFQALDKLN